MIMFKKVEKKYGFVYQINAESALLTMTPKTHLPKMSLVSSFEGVRHILPGRSIKSNLT